MVGTYSIWMTTTSQREVTLSTGIQMATGWLIGSKLRMMKKMEFVEILHLSDMTAETPLDLSQNSP